MPKPVYALIGSDLFLQLDKLSLLLRELGSDVQRNDFDGETADLAEVLDELRTFTMFAGSKVVVIRSAELFITRFREPLERYIPDPSGTGALVLRCSTLPANQRIYKLILKAGQVLDCNPPKDLIKWATDRAKQYHQIQLLSDAGRMLCELVGDDLGRLDNELSKLALLTFDQKISAALVSSSVSFQREQEMWDMTNQLAAGNTDDAVRRWRQLVQIDPTTEFRAVTWLTMWLEKVRKALALKRMGYSRGEVIKGAKLFPPPPLNPS